MRILLPVCLLMLCLSFPVFGGHTMPGGSCECGAPGCICDPGETPLGNGASLSVKSSHNETAALGSETLLVLGLLLLLLRYKA